MRWYRNVVSRRLAVQSVALLPISAMKLWASSDKGPRVSTATGKKHVAGREGAIFGHLPHNDREGAMMHIIGIYFGSGPL